MYRMKMVTEWLTDDWYDWLDLLFVTNKSSRISILCEPSELCVSCLTSISVWDLLTEHSFHLLIVSLQVDMNTINSPSTLITNLNLPPQNYCKHYLFVQAGVSSYPQPAGKISITISFRKKYFENIYI